MADQRILKEEEGGLKGTQTRSAAKPRHVNAFITHQRSRTHRERTVTKDGGKTREDQHNTSRGGKKSQKELTKGNRQKGN